MPRFSFACGDVRWQTTFSFFSEILSSAHALGSARDQRIIADPRNPVGKQVATGGGAREGGKQEGGRFVRVCSLFVRIQRERIEDGERK